MRAPSSAAPPGGNGTISRIGFSGYCASAAPENATAASRSASLRMGSPPPAEILDLEAFQRLAREQLFGREAALRQALLVVVAQERVEHVAVRLEAVGPPVLAQLALRLLHVRDAPRQHGRHR